MESKKFGLDTPTLQKIALVFKKFPQIERVLLYGSRAKGNFRKGSDIDLCLVGPSLTTTELLQIENALEDLLLAYKIDLSIYSQIENSELLEHIDRVGVDFYLPTAF